MKGKKIIPLPTYNLTKISFDELHIIYTALRGTSGSDIKQEINHNDAIYSDITSSEITNTITNMLPTIESLLLQYS